MFLGQDSGETRDRPDLDFVGQSNEKVKEFAQNLKDKKKKSIVVMQQGGAVAAGFWKENADAILASFFGGEQMAPAVFDVIYGRVNPSGKLPVTFPDKDNEQNLSPEQYPGVNNVSTYSEGL
jgi:beta-glucosidase